MPPKKAIGEKVRDAIKGHAGLVRSSSGGIYCNMGSTDVPFLHATITARVKDHLGTQYHQRKLKEKDMGDKLIQPQATAMMETQKMTTERTDFHRPMTNAFLAADIPFEKLNNQTLRQFLEHEMKRKIPSANTLRDHVTPLVNDTMDRIRKDVADHAVYLIIDETQDPKSRFCVNIMIGVLNGQPLKSKLLDVSFTERNDNKTIQHAVMEALQNCVARRKLLS